MCCKFKVKKAKLEAARLENKAGKGEAVPILGHRRCRLSLGCFHKDHLVSSLLRPRRPIFQSSLFRRRSKAHREGLACHAASQSQKWDLHPHLLTLKSSTSLQQPPRFHGQTADRNSQGQDSPLEPSDSTSSNLF